MQLHIGAVLEVAGGLLVMIGLFTRPAAFILSGEMAVAYFQFHYKWSEHLGWTWPNQNMGGEAVLLCFIFLLLAAHGSGMVSVDEGRALRKASAPKPAK
jgi:putative oxidoreductase